MATVSAGDGFPVAILNRNQPAFYCVPAELYEKMLDALDDQQLVKLVHERSQQPRWMWIWTATYELYGKVQEDALKEWQNLIKPFSSNLPKKLKKCCENPHITSAKLRGIKDCYKIKLRTSGFRLVYQVIDDTTVIVVVAVGKRERSEVYNLASERFR